jgi:hypothetical protein
VTVKNSSHRGQGFVPQNEVKIIVGDDAFDTEDKKPCLTSSSAIKSQISPNGNPHIDTHSSARQRAGLKEEHLLRNTDDPNEVVMLFEAKDIQKAKEFAGSADLREAMENAGVVDKPDIYFLG